MKKYFACFCIAFIIIICGVCMGGCNNGFKLVKSISLTTNGETKKFNSSTKPNFSITWYSAAEITEDEYNKAPTDRKLSTGNDKLEKLSSVTINEAIKAAKNATHYELVEEKLKGYWYKSYFDFYGSKKYHYFKGSYNYTYFDFVYAKVKNDTTIAIRTSSTETTYTVTSYNIVKF